MVIWNPKPKSQPLPCLARPKPPLLQRDSLLPPPQQVWFIDFGKSYVDPTPSECENELQELRDIFGVASPASPASPAGFDSPDSA